MGLTKYTKIEAKAEVLSPGAHKKAEDALRKQGKASISDLSDEERERLTKELGQTE